MTEPAGTNSKPASKCIWYVLATVAGEPRSIPDLTGLARDNGNEYIDIPTTVRLKLKQYQLLTGLGPFLLPMESVKYLIHRDFFEEGDAENLQDFAETSVDFQFLLEDGHE